MGLGDLCCIRDTNLSGVVSAQCENLDLRAWLGSSMLSSHPNGPYKPQQQSRAVGERESLFPLPVAIQKTHVSEEVFLVHQFTSICSCANILPQLK